MLKLALYGKGGIGKSTTCVNLALALNQLGATVLQIGCDPKTDSTQALHPDLPLTPILEHLRQNPRAPRLEEVLVRSPHGIYCAETGGPKPGLGCAGRGIALALEFLDQQRVRETFGIDCVLYDVLGDVVCGGFSTPMRKGFAEKVAIVTSGERMALHAARAIAAAGQTFAGRGYARMAGIIVNRAHEPWAESVADPLDREQWAAEEEALRAFMAETSLPELGRIHEDRQVRQAERLGKPVLELFPHARPSQQYLTLARSLWPEEARPA